MRRGTSSVDSTSTPRWFNVPGSPVPSMSTSFSGGSATAKFAYPGRSLAGSVAEELRVELDRRVEVGDIEGELDA